MLVNEITLPSTNIASILGGINVFEMLSIIIVPNISKLALPGLSNEIVFNTTNITSTIGKK